MMKKRKSIILLSAALVIAAAAAGFTACGGGAYELAETEIYMGSYAERDVQLVSGNAKKLKWSSSDESAVTVKDGHLSAQGASSADKDVTVTVKGKGAAQKITVHVQNNGRPKLHFDNEEQGAEVFDENGTATLSPYLEYDDEKYYYNLNYTATSADSSVVTASGTTLTGISAGTAEVTLKTNYKGLNLTGKINVTVKRSTTISFKKPVISLYDTEQELFNSKKLNPAVVESRVPVSDPVVGYEIIEGGEFVELDGSFVKSKAVGTALVRATFRNVYADVEVRVLPGYASASLFMTTASAAILKEETQGDFAGWQKYTYSEAAADANSHKDTSGASGVYFYSFNGGFGVMNERYNKDFADCGFHFIKFDMHVLSADRIGIRMDNTVSDMLLESHTGYAGPGTQGENWKRLDVGSYISGNGVYYYFFEDGVLADQLQNGHTYTVYLPVELIDNDIYGIYSITTVYAINKGSNSATLYFNNVQYVMDMPAAVKEVYDRKNAVVADASRLTLYATDDAAYNSATLGVTVSDCGRIVTEPEITYTVLSGAECVRMENNRVIAVAQGDAVVRASYTMHYSKYVQETYNTYEYEKQLFCDVEIHVGSLDYMVLFDESSVTVKSTDGQGVRLNAKVYVKGEESEQEITYAIVSGEEFIELQNGVVSYLAPGTAIVSATSNGVTAYVTVKTERISERVSFNTNGTLETVTEGDFAGAQKFTSTLVGAKSAATIRPCALYFDGLSLASLSSSSGAIQDYFVVNGYNYVGFDIYITDNVQEFWIEFMNTEFQVNTGNQNAWHTEIGTATGMQYNGSALYIVNKLNVYAAQMKANNWYTVYIPVKQTSTNKYVIGCVAVTAKSGSVDVYVKNAQFLKELPGEIHGAEPETFRFADDDRVELMTEGEFAGSYKYTGNKGWVPQTSYIESAGISFNGLTTGNAFDEYFFDHNYGYVSFKVYFTGSGGALCFRMENTTTLFNGNESGAHMIRWSNWDSWAETSGITILDANGDSVAGSKLNSYTQQWITVYLKIEKNNNTNPYTVVSFAFYHATQENICCYLKDVEFLTEIPAGNE